MSDAVQGISRILLRDIFKDLLLQTRSREDIASWAVSMMQKEDQRLLRYEPISDEDRIWSALQYLAGVDLKESENVYLHSMDDIESFLKERL